MNITKLGAVVAVAATLGACANSNFGPKETVGTVGGAALGGLIGSELDEHGDDTAATIAGIVIGGFIGNQIGYYMDQTDRQMAREAEYRALERYSDGSRSSWQNPNNGHNGYTVPTNTYQTSQGTYCREYQTTVVIDGRPETGVGTACRQPDGTWRIMG